MAQAEEKGESLGLLLAPEGRVVSGVALLQDMALACGLRERTACRREGLLELQEPVQEVGAEGKPQDDDREEDPVECLVFCGQLEWCPVGEATPSPVRGAS